MRLPFHVMAVAAAASLAFALPHQVHAATPAHQVQPGCIVLAPSLQKCGEEPYYQIEQDGRKVRLFIVDGQVKVHSEGPVTVSLALPPPPEQMTSLPTPVYEDDTVQIATLRDSQQRLFWMVSPIAAPMPRRMTLLCSLADCSGSHILLRIE